MPIRTLLFAFLFVAASFAQSPAPAPISQTIEINLSGASTPFPHFWEQMFGSGRANLSLRDAYRIDLRTVKGITDFKYVRFHAIFDDENGVYDEDGAGNPIYNWSYVDQIYDGLLANRVRPFVELSFMPKKLSASDKLHAFWYKPLPDPPKDWKKWEDLNYAFARHLIQRYGIDEVAQWYFEVWNEPNIDFWTGEPKDTTYYQLYDSAVRGLKRASPRLRVGGPATAQAAWAEKFIAHCAQNHITLDFFSTHVYGNDKAEDVFGTHEIIPRRDMVCRSVKKVHDQIAASAMPRLPLIWSEFNASYANEPAVTDAPFMGPWMANTIRECDGLVNMMSYWTFSDVFEEQGISKTPFYGGFGLIAQDSIPKAAFNAFKLLHRLGTQRLPANSEDVLVTKTANGKYVLAVWNYAPPEQAGPIRHYTLHFTGPHASHAIVSIVDPDHGNVVKAFVAMGRPAYPTRQQIIQLRAAAELGPPQQVIIESDTLTLTLPSYGLALVELQ